MDLVRARLGCGRAAGRPGAPRIGCLATLAVGIAGALIGGLIGQVVLGHKVHFGWDARPFALAVIGSIVLLLVLDAVAERPGRTRRR